MVRLHSFARNSHCIFELNSTNLVVLLVFWLLGILPRTAIYDHNSSRHIWGRAVRRFFFLEVLKRCAGVRVVHEHLRNRYEQHGFGAKVVVESPFLPPVEEEYEGIVSGYPKELLSFLQGRDVLKVATSAWKFVPFKDGQDLYGIAQFVELLDELAGSDRRIHGLLVIGSGSSADFPPELRERVERLTCGGVLLVVFGQYEFWPIYRSLDLFLRLTGTDGNSVSVLESIYYNCPVIASDVVPRPDGVETYQYADSADLRRQVLKWATKN